MYSENEIETIKKIFAENDYLLIAVRKLFFGADLTDEEKKVVKSTFKDAKVKEIFRKKFYGELNLDTPIGQVSDFWMGAEMQVFGATRDTIYQSVQSKTMIMELFRKAFDLLDNPDGEKIKLDVLTIEADPLQVSLLARNLYLKAVETALFTVKTIAGQKEESIEQAMKRLQQDSAK